MFGGKKINRDAREEVTILLKRWSAGDAEAGNSVMSALYEQLRSQAHRALRRERSHHTLQPTALVHEACLRLLDLERIEWQDRNHFLRAAAKTMRRVLVDYARHRGRAKRGHGQVLLPLEAGEGVAITADEDLETLDHALVQLGELDPTKAEIVELRYFGGFSVDQTAELMGVSRATIVRQWRLTRVWIRELMA